MVQSILKEKNYTKGTSIFLENDPCHKAYILKEGKVKVSKFSSDGKEIIIKFFKSGDFFGEAPLFIEEGKYPVSAYAYENTSVLYFTKTDFKNLIVKSPDIAFAILELFSRKLLMLVDQVEMLSMKDVTTKIIIFLINLIPKDNKLEDNIEIILPSSQSDIASSLGSVREHVSRVFSKLAQLGLLELQGKKVIIKKLSEIKKMLLY